ncbi:MAG: ABC transporter ATP-binding protein [bacterium]
MDLLLEVKNLRTYFFLDEGTVRAVDGVSFEVARKKTLGVVGESGCGKSVTAQSILRIVPHPGRIIEGEILFHQKTNGREEILDLTKLDPQGKQIKQIRGKEISMIFQEPMTSFSPVYTIGNQIMEAILLHQNVNKKQAREHAIEMLDRVGIPDARRRIDAYPHQLSGGMRQRAMIAMALSCNPSLLIADEPTTALDVTVQAQILDLMQHLQDEFGMSIMIITHNLGVIAEMADYVVVMYLGEEVEYSDVDTIFHDPKHPYTQALLRSIPKVGPKMRVRLESIKGWVPDPFAVFKGCAFFPRCNYGMPGVCTEKPPIPTDIGGGHKVACYLYEEVKRATFGS